MKLFCGKECGKANYSKYISIKGEDTVLMTHFFKLLHFQYEISPRRRGHWLGIKLQPRCRYLTFYVETWVGSEPSCSELRDGAFVVMCDSLVG